MLAGIIQTIIMALGIATGNISSNAYKGGNVFNDETKPTIKKANNEMVEFFNETELTTIQTIGNPNTEGSNKYYIGNNNNTPNKTTNYVNVYNSIYVYSNNTTNNTGYHYIRTITLMRLDNYTEFNMTDIYIDINYTAQITTNSPYYYENRLYQLDDGYDNLIDRTLTTTTSANDIYTEIYTEVDKVELNHTNGDNAGNNTGTNGIYVGMVEVASTIVNIPAHSNIIIASLTDVYIDGNGTITFGNYYNNEEGRWLIKGYPTIQTINYEVVDIPGIMYTVLTMPFSFISGAFNLTIFPGTPYQLNFSNLLLTLLAIFILLWIIKKVFH